MRLSMWNARAEEGRIQIEHIVAGIGKRIAEEVLVIDDDYTISDEIVALAPLGAGDIWQDQNAESEQSSQEVFHTFHEGILRTSHILCAKASQGVSVNRAISAAQQLTHRSLDTGGERE